MKQFVINLETISPLTIRADHAQGGSETTQYISGTTLLGSLASAHRFIRSDRTDEFARLFLNDAVQYPNLYPVSLDYDKDGRNDGNASDNTARHEEQDMKIPVYPLPKTAQTCKRFKGFKYHEEGDDEERHGVRDTLIDRALYHLGSVSDTTKLDMMPELDMMRHYSTCLECQATMDHFSGYYSRSDAEPEKIVKAKIDTRLQAHTGINRQTGTVQQSILYNREVLEEGMRFRGVVNLPDDDKLAEAFQAFVESVGGDGLVRVGTGRTRGMGKVSLRVEPVLEGRDTFENFQERLEKFNDTIARQADTFGITQPAQRYVAVTLHSPAILRDDLLRYEGTLTSKTLARQAHVRDETFDSFQLVYQAASTRRITGWNELWGTPKVNDYAIETGSVFLFTCPSNPDDEVFRLLYQLEQRGIGQRRAEGFGRIRISDPFHREVEVI